jgi:hypothetical protein
MLHLRRCHALEPDVHAPDHDGVAIDHARPTDQALGGRGRRDQEGEEQDEA